MINNDKKTFSDVQKDNAEYKDLQASADAAVAEENTAAAEIGRASCRERVSLEV